MCGLSSGNLPQRIHPRPFIPAWLDDFDLTPQQFRVYANLARRADKNGVAWPSRTNIAQCCKLNSDTVGAALNKLEYLGLVKRKERIGTSNLYTVLTPLGNGGVPETEGDPATETEGDETPETKGAQPPETKGDKGIPCKDIQPRESREGGPVAPSFVSVVLTEQAISSLQKSYRTTAAGIAEALDVFNAKKRQFFKADGQQTATDFKAWLSTRQAAQVLGEYPAQGASAQLGPAEPDGWRRFAENHYSAEGFADHIGNLSWYELKPEVQRNIIQEIAPMR